MKTLKVKDIFGKLKLKKSTEEIMRQIDKELNSKIEDRNKYLYNAQ